MLEGTTVCPEKKEVKNQTLHKEVEGGGILSAVCTVPRTTKQAVTVNIGQQ